MWKRNIKHGWLLAYGLSKSDLLSENEIRQPEYLYEKCFSFAETRFDFIKTSFWLILLFHVACLVRFDLHLILTHLSGCLFGLFGCTDQIHLSGCLFRIVAISTLSQLTFSGCLFGSFRFAPYLNSPFRLPVLVRFDLYFIVTYLLAFAERCFSLPDTFYSHYGKRFPVLVLDCADPTPLDRLSDIPNFVVRTLFFHQTFPNIMFCTQHNVAWTECIVTLLHRTGFLKNNRIKFIRDERIMLKTILTSKFFPNFF